MEYLKIRVHGTDHGNAVIKQLVLLGCIDAGERHTNPNWLNVMGIYANGKSINFMHRPNGAEFNASCARLVTIDDLYEMGNKSIMIHGKPYSEETIHAALKAYVE